MYDVIFDGCTVVDGSGDRSFVADVAVQGGKIAAVGGLAHAEAQRRVSGSGKVLAPGFIDMHTHSDLPLLVNNKAESKIRQGVTTEVIGNCGFGPAPLTAETKPEIRGMSTFLAKGSEALNWEWLTFGEYLDALDGNGAALNVVPLAGHGQDETAPSGHHGQSERRSDDPPETGRTGSITEQRGLGAATFVHPNPQSILDGLRVGFVNVSSGNLTFERRDIVVPGETASHICSDI